ncbi:MAG: glycogen/starch/alpha-glucan phosphorylase [Clostridiales bacterium]|nr:glycogen/starch/alpha-glucan phosphorylase [Clostridiales bacterium]
MSTKLTEQKALQLLEETLRKYGEADQTIDKAPLTELYRALAIISHDMLVEKREKYHIKVSKSMSKRVHYLCMEFLLGRNLKTTMFNLKTAPVFEKILKDRKIDIEDIYEVENDAGLGNGGLGRLAACFMDSLATMGYPNMGHSILYEYGFFKQKIVDGEQVELTDSWRSTGDYWLQKRSDKTVFVKFGGTVTERIEDGRLIPEYRDYTEVSAVPYDMVLSGYNSTGVGVLRLWEAKAVNKFDFKSFSQGAYVQAVAESSEMEMISKVLYPADDHESGKTLRLKQQYFLVSAALQNIVATHIKRYRNLKTLPQLVSIHINDTHPALSIPELMRILMDEYGWSWDSAWAVVNKTINYTNHTVLMEALEKWDEKLFANVLPRIYQIVKEINRRFTKELLDNHQEQFDLATIEKMAIISQGQVRMANLSVVGCGKVNGVSALHSDIIRTQLFRPFSELYPKKFTNVTNGIAHRRWLCQSNPNLAKLIEDCIGTDYYLKPDELKKLEKWADDPGFLQKLKKVKDDNKKDFVAFLKKHQGVEVNPNHRFDVHIKRIHEYKRQLLNVLKIIYLYSEIIKNPDAEVTEQVFFFGGKSAPKYYMAKRIIKLIGKLSADIDKNPLVRGRLKVVMLENYNVSVAEKIIPASEVSEQVSLAGKEASGTGNMKFMSNGALTLGTFDGANVEMTGILGDDNIFIFGLTADRVDQEWKIGYNPKEIYDTNPKVKRVVDMLKTGFAGESFADIAEYLIGGTRPDPYMCLIDFDSYIQAHYRMDELYKNQKEWNKLSCINIARSGFFAADRSIGEYADNIWHLNRVE